MWTDHFHSIGPWDVNYSVAKTIENVCKPKRICTEQIHKRIPESGRSRSAGKSFRNNSGRRVLCEFKVSAGACTRAKVANDSLGV